MIITDLAELRKPNLPATDDEWRGIIADLETALAASVTKGVGLSAPQIGIHKRVAIVRCDGENLDLVNPKVVDKEGLILVENESCLSMPGVKVNTWRSTEVFVVDDLHPAGVSADGLEAIVLQHEIDHLDSLLVIDRAAGKGKEIGRAHV